MPDSLHQDQGGADLHEGGSHQLGKSDQDHEDRRAENRKKLLLVEDDPEVAAGLEDFFSIEGFGVACVADGSGALPAIQSAAYDLIVLDLRLPRKDGFDVLREIREAGMEMPILVLSVLDRPAHRQRCLDLGADAYLTKPFNVEHLAERVRELLGLQ